MKLIILFIIIVFLAGCFGAEPQKTGKEGKALPDFSLLSTDSITWLHTRKIPSDKSFVLFYYSPYCPHCKAETEEITEDMDDLKNINFYFISPFPMSAIKAFSKEYKLAQYPNITVSMDTSSLIANYFEIKGVPYMAIYNKNKKLNKTFMGEINSGQIKKVAEE